MCHCGDIVIAWVTCVTAATLLSLGLHVSLRRHCYRLHYMGHSYVFLIGQWYKVMYITPILTCKCNTNS